MDAFAHCEQLVRRADKDRFFAALFAPAKYRRALFALYAFNVEVARVREVAREALPGEVRLQFWVDLLDNKGRGEIDQHPVASALADTIVRYRIRPHSLAELIEARRFDLYNDPFATLTEFEDYAEKTSSVLIELAAQILNNGNDAGVGALARHAGIAYAIAGILQAFPAHAARGQVYLPLDLLRLHNVRAENTLGAPLPSGVRQTIAEMDGHCLAHLSRARELLADAPLSVLPALLPVSLVRPTLKRLRRRRHDPRRRFALSAWRRQWIIWRAARDPRRIA
jgi:phytoene synthase